MKSLPDIKSRLLGPKTGQCAISVRGALHDLIRAAEEEQDATALANAEAVFRMFRTLFPESSPQNDTPVPYGEHGGGARR